MFERPTVPPKMTEKEEADLRALGADDQYIAEKANALAEKNEKHETDFVLWPDLEPPLEVFKRCRWNVVTSMAGAFWSGIDAVEIEAVARMIKTEMTADLLDDIRLMESAASKVLNAKVKND